MRTVVWLPGMTRVPQVVSSAFAVVQCFMLGEKY